MNTLAKLSVAALSALLLLATGCGRSAGSMKIDVPIIPTGEPPASAPRITPASVDPVIAGDPLVVMEPDLGEPAETGTIDFTAVPRPVDSIEPPTRGPYQPPACQGSSQVAILIKGVNQGTFEHVFVGIADLKLGVDGCQVPIKLLQTNVDLGGDQPYALAKVVVPLGARTLRVHLEFDCYGAYESSATCGAIKAGNVLDFEVPIRAVSCNAVALVKLDVTRSLPALDGKVMLLPQLQVSY